MQVKNVTIYKPQNHASFEVGANLIIDKKEIEVKVTKITIGLFKKVTVYLSTGKQINFCGFPLSYEK